ncbi:MAG TPA: L-arabinose isomerase [Anaerohalosphaeraceae bacterium]|jgi:L-arabinose isomerase|nr:L-arabinose isomerase [Anaerohalosphaeraceae bacterium]HRT50878.1 L-arabinose isomerase [Anaerohalosphaeraceae bacterium]HRT86860.1 L-arabinose isomerase [Anaerohalosphaeraceae bacterium]
MKNLKQFEAWFITGSQHLYGEEVLKQVDEDSKRIAAFLDQSETIPCRIVFKPVVKTPDEILNICTEANTSPNCVGLITWMHTFSPAKMWIAGLRSLNKPFAHLHTQFNRDIPWDRIDMDFMNLNQSAHGDREFGFICSRLRKNRKVIVGHWQDDSVLNALDIWLRAACAWHDWQGMKVARFGDNMREVAVTEGDKVEAQKQFGYSVNGYGVGDLVAAVNAVKDDQVDALVADYRRQYEVDAKASLDTIRQAARIEAGMRNFLTAGGFNAFTTTFEDLHGLVQLPGLAVQRLMADGYGFGAEGDWKTAALVRAMKVMAAGMQGGTSFMEDYTYHLDPADMKVLGAHMLEVCPTVAGARPALEVHPLGIGGKADPARLVFCAPEGKGINVSLMDMGNRFRMIANPCKVMAPNTPLPNLPVARVLWKPEPDLKTAAAAWILGGGAHHTGFSMALTEEHLSDFAEIAGIEYLLIDRNTTIAGFKQDLRINETYYALANGFK